MASYGSNVWVSVNLGKFGSLSAVVNGEAGPAYKSPILSQVLEMFVGSRL